MNNLDKKENLPLKIFHEQFSEYLSTDDCMEFYTNRTNKGKSTFLCSDIYSAEKLATVIVEEYAIRGKLRGNVIVIYPETGFDVPIFTFQLGGNGTDSIALLDISPTLPGIDYGPIIPLHEKHARLLGIENANIDWVQSICSPYLLHCHYRPLNEALFIEALREYLAIWISHYYLPGKALADKRSIESVTNAVYKYKRVLHDNDPAYGIFVKEWGKPAADAFYHLETRDHPALPMPDETHKKIKAWKNLELNIVWDNAAQERVMEAPESVHQFIRDAIEPKVAEANIGIITLDVFEKYKEGKSG